MSDYKVNTDGGFVHDELAERLVKLADEKLPEWAVILMDEDGAVFAYNDVELEMRGGRWQFKNHRTTNDSYNLSRISPIGLDWTRFGIFRTGGKGKKVDKPKKPLPDYEVVSGSGDFFWFDKFVKAVSKKLKNWAEIRFDEDGKCFAYTHKPHREKSWWVARNGKSWCVTHPDGFDFIDSDIDWEEFGIFRTKADKPKKSKKPAPGIHQRLVTHSLKLSLELSATRAMLEEAQKEIAELQSQPIPPHVQQSWYDDGWGAGAADMLKAAQMAEAGLIGEYNASREEMNTVRGAAFVVGAIANAFQQGRRVNLEWLTAEGEEDKM